MTTARQYRSKAAESAQLARQGSSTEEVKSFARAERSYLRLAENEEWMIANADKVVRADSSRK